MGSIGRIGTRTPALNKRFGLLRQFAEFLQRTRSLILVLSLLDSQDNDGKRIGDRLVKMFRGRLHPKSLRER
jgi:hypothetical protein